MNGSGIPNWFSIDDITAKRVQVRSIIQQLAKQNPAQFDEETIDAAQTDANLTVDIEVDIE